MRGLALGLALVLASLALLTGCGVQVTLSPSTSAPHVSVQPAANQTTPPLVPNVSTTTLPSSSPSPSVSQPALPGFLGVVLTNPPSDWTVSGCEIQNVLPKTPAAEAGLVGAENRTDPVGDVITALVIGGTVWPTPSCAALHGALSHTRPGETIGIHYEHRVVFILGHWAARQVSVMLATPPCPGPLTGPITPVSAGDRIGLPIELKGPVSSATLHVIIDTGAYVTMLPNSLLQQLGFKPSGQVVVAGVVPGATTVASVYSIPGQDFLVADQGRAVPLVSGVIMVDGISHGDLYLLSPQLFKNGAQFSISAGGWSLTPVCP